MSFIDYNFFPILFFLGWNILTTKQFRPSIYKTSNLKTSPELSVFSLINQKTLQADLKAQVPPIVSLQAKRWGGTQKRNDILQFVPGFQFLSTSSLGSSPSLRLERNDRQSLENKTRNSSLFSSIENTEAENQKSSRVSSVSSTVYKKNRLIDKTKTNYFTHQNWMSKNWKGNFKSNFFDFSYRSKKKFIFSSFFPYKIKPETLVDGIFFEGLCSSKNNSFFWKKTKKQFFNPVFYPQATFFTIETNTKKINSLNFIQKRRSKIRFLLRIPTQKIYSLNKFQIALCFSKILQPPILFNDNFHFKSTSSFSNENENEFMLKGILNTESPKMYNSMFNYVKDKFEPPTRVSENVFAEFQAPPVVSLQTKATQPETSYVYNYKRRKKSYMKTQFFQHVAWNMKHKISNRFLDVEYLFHTTGLPVVVSSNSKLENPYTKVGEAMGKYSNLITYGGSWYYENLSFPYSVFNTLPKISLSPLQSKATFIFSRWHRIFSKQKHVTENGKKLLESKQFSIAWLNARRYNLLQNFRYWPYKNKLEYEISILDRNQTPYFIKNKFGLGSADSFTSGLLASREDDKIGEAMGKYPNPIALQISNINDNQKAQDISLSTKLPINPMASPILSSREARRPLLSFREARRPILSFRFAKRLDVKPQAKPESDIGIYSLAHKLSSVGFRNGNSEMDIYPFKYNDSYRYNFQNMNLSDYHLGQRPVFSKENTDASEGIHFSNCRKFLDFQNPSFSKIYAPLFQPQGLNLLSFIYNSFLQIIPILNAPSSNFFGLSRETREAMLPSQLPLIINEYPHALKGVDRPFKSLPSINETSQLKTFNSIHHKLPINGIHTNPYPWITQNASDRWSEYNHLFTLADSSFLGFSETKPKYQQANALFKKNIIPTTQASRPVFSRSEKIKSAKPWGSTQPTDSSKAPFFLAQNARSALADRAFGHSSLSEDKLGYASEFSRENVNTSVLKTSLKTDAPMTLQKEAFKNPNSQSYFTEKPSCIKKPSIFFSSFRHLPYFFVSETRSTKNEIFPQANLSLFPLFGSDSIASPILSSREARRPDVKRQAEPETINHSLKDSNKKSASYDFSVPDIKLFHRSVLKQNEKKRVVKPWKGYFQQKSFSLKPLSTFLKKEIGYQTSLFSKRFSTQSPVSKGKDTRKSLFVEKLSSFRLPWKENFSPFRRKQDVRSYGEGPNKDAFFVPNLFATKKADLSFLQKNTWKIFPPLFQPLTFRFIDLNLPRTWSSELLTSTFKNMPENNKFENTKTNKKCHFMNLLRVKPQAEPNLLSQISPVASPPVFSRSEKIKSAKPWGVTQTKKWNNTQKNFFCFPIPFYFSDFFRFSASVKSTLPINDHKNENLRFSEESSFPLTDFFRVDESKQQWNNSQRFEKKNGRSLIYETSKFQNSKIIVYGEKPLLKNRTIHGPPLKNQKESISLPSYLKNITNQNYQNLCPNNLNELYFVFWILFNKTLFIYLSLHYLRKFISFLGTEYIRNLFKIFVTMKFIDGNVLSIIKTFQDFNFQLNQQNVIDIKVNNQLKNIKRN